MVCYLQAQVLQAKPVCVCVCLYYYHRATGRHAGGRAGLMTLPNTGIFQTLYFLLSVDGDVARSSLDQHAQITGPSIRLFGPVGAGRGLDFFLPLRLRTAAGGSVWRQKALVTAGQTQVNGGGREAVTKREREREGAHTRGTRTNSLLVQARWTHGSTHSTNQAEGLRGRSATVWLTVSRSLCKQLHFTALTCLSLPHRGTLCDRPDK